jgi:pyruvate dehydrogenase E2 component (dihydrolipoamide acetyltransferase)
MAVIFRMPALSPTMVSGTIVSWLKKEGDEIAVGDVIVEIDTDKATMEVESIHKGVLEKIFVSAGARDVNVGVPIGLIREKVDTDETIQKALAELEQQSEPKIKKIADDRQQSPKEAADKTVKISPLAKRISGMHGVDFTKIQRGTGPGGRIVKVDILEVLASGNDTTSSAEYTEVQHGTAPGGRIVKADVLETLVSGKVPEHSGSDNTSSAEYTEESLSQVQRYIAGRLTQSWHDAPHFYMTISANVTELLKVKAQLNDNGAIPVKLTVTDFIIKASALALAECPSINVSWNNGIVRNYNKANISVVIATPDGIFSPVIYEACSKGIVQISRELKELASLARSKKIPPEKFDGGAMTISNLGMYGIDGFFAIINTNQGTALSVGPAKKTPVCNKDGDIVPADVVQFGYSVDHRLINGVDAAIFLEKLVKYIESPLSLVMH